MIIKPEKEVSKALYEQIVALKDKEACYRFFQDLCSITELRAMEQRYDVAKLLYEDCTLFCPGCQGEMLYTFKKFSRASYLSAKGGYATMSTEVRFTMEQETVLSLLRQAGENYLSGDSFCSSVFPNFRLYYPKALPAAGEAS